MKKLFPVLVLFLLLVSTHFNAEAQDKISVAVAANFISPFREIAACFEEKTGIKVESTFSSTGSLYSQIVNGAPYDLFLSADEKRPAVLCRDGLADKTFIYARGRVILWSADKNFCKSAGWKEALQKNRIKRIALANPATAPYGEAAKKALEKAGLWDILQKKIVTAHDIAQSFQYANISAVDAAFCAHSTTISPEGKNGCFLAVDEAPEIVQSACLLKRTSKRAAAEKFIEFLDSSESEKIKSKYGYR